MARSRRIYDGRVSIKRFNGQIPNRHAWMKDRNDCTLLEDLSDLNQWAAAAAAHNQTDEMTDAHISHYWLLFSFVVSDQTCIYISILPSRNTSEHCLAVFSCGHVERSHNEHNRTSEYLDAVSFAPQKMLPLPLPQSVKSEVGRECIWIPMTNLLPIASWDDLPDCCARPVGAILDGSMWNRGLPKYLFKKK